MGHSGLHARRLGPPLAARAAPSVVDEFLVAYVSWREEAVAVQSVYDHWQAVRARDQALAFAAYRAALDREEHAAKVFSTLAEQMAAAGA